jgi:carbonic anhydrase/acetyltransferase-like protein (isoleucine patch superfamily)
VNKLIFSFKGETPDIHASCFIASSANVIGNVKIGEGTSIWYNAVLRGDLAPIIIGKDSNVQECSVIHVDEEQDVVIGNGVTIGHGAIIHGCHIGDNCLIGMGSIILNGAEIGENSIIGAGALVTSGKKIPPNSLVLGSPGKVIREITKEELDATIKNGKIYVKLGQEFKN